MWAHHPVASVCRDVCMSGRVTAQHPWLSHTGVIIARPLPCVFHGWPASDMHMLRALLGCVAGSNPCTPHMFVTRV